MMSIQDQIRHSSMWFCLLLNICFAIIILIPFVSTYEEIEILIPECEWKIQYNKSCPMCGMTASFFYISEGEFRLALSSNKYSVLLLLFMLFSEILFLFFLALQSKHR